MNYRSVISQINFSVSHIFRKGNSLANHNAAHVEKVDVVPLFLASLMDVTSLLCLLNYGEN